MFSSFFFVNDISYNIPELMSSFILLVACSFDRCCPTLVVMTPAFA